MKIVLGIVSLLLASSFVIGQEKSPDCASCKCPKTKIEVSSHVTKAGETVIFEVVVVDPKLKQCTLTYDWLVSSGEIISGQSTKSIRLKVPEGRAGTTISVAASVNNDNGCESNPSETIEIKP
ncbi:MAG TPA: hypothetical protein VGQ55_14540 [Pyrinomonadaceae bacterium]|jgi:hypothetical protein|nr:hypothetical protein [Pyrinomonadaceae bacterium]